MRPRLVNFDGEKLIIKCASVDERHAFKKYSTVKYYERLLGLVVNKKYTVNSFNGQVNKLVRLIKKIEEVNEK